MPAGRRDESLRFQRAVRQIFGEPLQRLVADIMVSLAGHVAVKVYMGEYWTGAYSDYNNVRRQFRNLAIYGFFGPPVFELWRDVKELRFKDERVEKLWVNLEEQVEKLLIEHADEVEALVEKLLDVGDLSNPEIMDILGKNSVQRAKDEGKELESVLEVLGTSPEGLAYKRRARLPDAQKKKPTPVKAAEGSNSTEATETEATETEAGD